ncbi:MAG: sigma-E processing peptidase SpoIIGA [Clostridia bacterium]|nr:sigma-E processing peptidase SpoIIGA [Clostridia bacterium]
MKIVYVDTLFFLNFAVDYCLLFLTARLCGQYRRRRFLLLGAAVGAVFAVILYFPVIPPFFSIPLRLGVCAVVTFAAFGRQSPRRLLHLGGMFAFLSFAMAGLVMLVALLGGEAASRNGVVYFRASALAVGAGFGLLYLASMWLMGRGRAVPGRGTVEVRAQCDGREIRFRALRDSGNLLRDPSAGRPVILVDRETAAGLFSKETAELLRKGACVEQMLAQLSETEKGPFWLLPLQTAAARGLAVVFRPEGLWVDGKERKDDLFGIAPEPIHTGGDCRGLIGA